MFEVRVEGSKGREWVVRFGALTKSWSTRLGQKVGWTCTCPAFIYQKSPHSGHCKHTRAVVAAMGAAPAEVTV